MDLASFNTPATNIDPTRPFDSPLCSPIPDRTKQPLTIGSRNLTDDSARSLTLMQVLRCIDANVSTSALRGTDTDMSTSSSSWLRLFRRLSGGGTVRVLVLGGSMTAGISCSKNATLTLTACSWSGRFVDWLDSEFPQAKIVYENRARGGTQTEVALGGIAALLTSDEAVNWDIVFTDFFVNDVRAPGIVKKGLQVHGGSSADRLSILNEKLILTIKALAPTALHVNIISSCPDCVSNLHLARAVSLTYSFHGVSLINLAAPCFGPLKKILLCNWGAITHPTAAVHQEFANAVASHFKRRLTFLQCLTSRTQEPFGRYHAQGVKGSFWGTGVLAKVHVCLRPLITFDAYSLWKNKNTSLTWKSSWNLTEDRPGKPGWITSQNGAVLPFNLTFGSLPMMSITYLRSYEGLGDAEIRLNGHTWVLNGVWEDPGRNRISVSQTVVFHASQVSQKQHELFGRGIVGFGVKPHSSLPVEFVFRSQKKHSKFKIISVSAC